MPEGPRAASRGSSRSRVPSARSRVPSARSRRSHRSVRSAEELHISVSDIDADYVSGEQAESESGSESQTDSDLSSSESYYTSGSSDTEGALNLSVSTVSSVGEDGLSREVKTKFKQYCKFALEVDRDCLDQLIKQLKSGARKFKAQKPRKVPHKFKSLRLNEA